MKHTEETKRKISESLKGRKSYERTEETRKKMSENAKKQGLGKMMIGKHHTDETKEKIGLANSLALKGKKPSEETKRKMSETHKERGTGKWMKGRNSENLIKFQKGNFPWNKGTKGLMPSKENHIAWIKDRTKLQKRNVRNDSAYQNWVKEIKKRDVECKLKNDNCLGYLIVHHILSWSKYPELRYEINNGITLCQFHHPRKRIDEIRLIPVL